MVPQRSVLVVDRSEETREVLRTALERRGLRVLSAGARRRGLELARQHHPDLIVLDLEIENSSQGDVIAPFAEVTEADDGRLLLLGSMHRGSAAPARGQLVAKPYHFGPLIRKIEELLEGAGRALARSA